MGKYDNQDRERSNMYNRYIKKKIPLVAGWARQGLNNEEIADLLGVSISTFNRYRERYAAFDEAVLFNRTVADTLVENALFKRALGYKYKEQIWEPRINADGEEELVLTKETYKQVVPDVKAQIFWLTNRKKSEWRETPEVDITINNQQAIKEWLEVTGFSAKQVSELYNDEEDVFEEDLRLPPKGKETEADEAEFDDEDEWEDGDLE